MRILIDGTTMCTKEGTIGAGIEHYTWHLIEALIREPSEHTFLLYTPLALPEMRLRALIEQAQANVEVIRTVLPRMPLLSRHVLTPLRWYLARPDVVLLPSGQAPFFWGGHTIASLHDTIIYEHPEWFPEGESMKFSTRVVVPRTFERANRVVAVSQAAAQAAATIFPVLMEKMEVVYPGVEVPEQEQQMATVPARFPYEKDMVLFLGTIEPRKQIELVEEAFDLFLRQHPESARGVRLVIAGKRGWNAQEIYAVAEQINDAWREVVPDGVIHFLGEVTEEEKWNLLRRATVFVYPSHKEGFGLPVLEAMAASTPTIISQDAALQEVGGDAAIVIDGKESLALALAQSVLLPEGISLMKTEGVRRAQQFTWQKTARTIKVIAEEIFTENKKTPE